MSLQIRLGGLKVTNGLTGQRKTFTKECSRLMQGIAVLLMIYHHQFAISFPHESFVFGDALFIEQKIAWLCRICTSIFSFCSGYGICLALSRNTTYFQNCISIIKKLYLFILSYWFILVCVAPFEIIKAGVSLKKILLAFTTYDMSFNGGWWYVSQYIYMLILAPSLMEMLVGMKNRETKKLLWGGGTALCIFIVSHFFLHKGSSLFLLIFILGMLASYTNAFSRVFLLLDNLNITAKIMCVTVIILCAMLRVLLSKNPSDAWMDIFLTPIITLFISYLYVNHSIKWIEFLGENSLWIWLFSTVIQQIYEYEIKSLHFSEYIVFVVYLSSIVIGIFLRMVFNRIYKNILIILKRRARQ